ncbi:MAG: hypothetical protein HUU49_04865 [Candidatus Buchananbacteria bacterium]|nr:hypothetical protein [Candidatus Buchananbacteria bacterium]
MNKKIKFLLTFLLLLGILTLNVTPVLAQGLQDPAKQKLDAQNEAFLAETGLGTQTSLSLMVSAIIRVFLSFLGVIFVVLIIYAGFMWMTSAGNEDKISKAKKIMASAIIGLAIVLAAYAITYFVLDQLLEATKGGQGLD